MLKGEEIICISWLYWDEIPLVMHHMMTRLAEHNRILWVDPPFPLTSFITRAYPAGFYLDKVRMWWNGVKKFSDNLWIYYPPPLLFFYGRARINDRLNQFILSRLIQKVEKALLFDSPILWLYHPYAVTPRGQFNEKLVCYDCNDDIGAFFHRLPYQRERLDELERRLVKQADVVFTTSEALYRSKKSVNSNTYYFPSGADISLFSKTLLPDTEISKEMKTMKKPVVGFVGGIANTKMNWEWIEKAGILRPQWTFVFVGPCHEKLPPEITRLPNLHFLGKRPMEDLPNYLKAFDVGMIPYRDSEFMRNAFPTKTFEYLAAGKPVVASDIPALRPYQPFVRLCRDAEEFVMNLEKGIEDSNNAEIRSKGAEIAADQTWDARVQKTSAVIRDLLCARDEHVQNIRSEARNECCH